MAIRTRVTTIHKKLRGQIYYAYQSDRSDGSPLDDLTNLLAGPVLIYMNHTTGITQVDY